MEIHVTRSVELVVCLAAIDTMVNVCVDLGGGETDVTVTATMFNNLLILIKSTLQLLKIFANSKLKWMNWSHYRKWFLVRLEENLNGLLIHYQLILLYSCEVNFILSIRYCMKRHLAKQTATTKIKTNAVSWYSNKSIEHKINIRMFYEGRQQTMI